MSACKLADSIPLKKLKVGPVHGHPGGPFGFANNRDQQLLYGRPAANLSLLAERRILEPDEAKASATGGGKRRRSKSAEEAEQQAQSSDILVRLIGRSHAKCALQYFSCYLMSSSITILLCLWLGRLISAHNLRKQNKWAARALFGGQQFEELSVQSCGQFEARASKQGE